MFVKVTEIFRGPAQEADAPSVAVGGMADRLQVLNSDPYLSLADTALRLISVFDDLKYDRADMDAMSGPMRRRALDKLRPLGFRQVSGSLFENRTEGVRMHLPKFRALGASPFDATRDTVRGEADYFILTPTQTACRFIDLYPTDEAVERIKALIVKHPINLLRIADFLERTETHDAFRGAIGHLKYVQREAVSSEPLRTRRALR